MEHSEQAHLIQALQDPSLYPHSITKFQVIETHISWVLLTGPFAYKIKKSVDFGFVNFTTLGKRKFFCEEEMRLNKRLAPQLYNKVLPIFGSSLNPTFESQGLPIEYAVQMQQFTQEKRLDELLTKGGVQERHILQFAEDLASFHSDSEVAGHETLYGTPEVLRNPVQECLDDVARIFPQSIDQTILTHLGEWMQTEWEARRSTFIHRKQDGFIRECHGDLHLANVILWKDHVMAFDCLEFNPTLRWIDVLSEVAFFVMDLEVAHHPDLASPFLNRYLEKTGDYAGLTVVRFYKVYRALVRAKVAALSCQATHEKEAGQASFERECVRYLRVATQLTHPPKPFLCIMHGLSGSGKSTVSDFLLKKIDVIRVRSDVERKRLLGFHSEAKTPMEQSSSVYSSAMTDRTYEKLKELTKDLLKSGYSVVVDATFLRYKDRQAFSQLANWCQVPMVLLDIQAPPDELRRRIGQRLQKPVSVSEASLKVLEEQLVMAEALRPEERAHTIEVDSMEEDYAEKVVSRIGKEAYVRNKGDG